MSREIKFRAWDKKNKVMTLVESLVGLLGKYHPRPQVTMLIDNELHGNHRLDKLILMQYTGLKDKNGVEIYEGDIVTAEHPEDEDGDMDKVYAVVVYDAPSFYAKYVDDNLNQFISGEQGFVLNPRNRVINNIYENPELLEVMNE